MATAFAITVAGNGGIDGGGAATPFAVTNERYTSIPPGFQFEHAHHLRKSCSLIAQLGRREFRFADDRRILLGRLTDLRDSKVDLFDATRLLARGNADLRHDRAN